MPAFYQLQLMISQSQPSSPSSQQLTDTIIMIRPHHFSSNQMTLLNNHFQQKNQQSQVLTINAKAQQEFDNFAYSLKNKGINVIVVQDSGEFHRPDSIFPNNWVSFHKNEGYILYPMFALNRRLQRKINIFEPLQKAGHHPKLLRDYSKFQEQGIYLEGTGSMVLDRQFRIAFAAISARTNKDLFLRFCSQNNYQPCIFSAFQTVQGRREPIYHTNVMMWIGQGVCGVCLSAIDDPTERQQLQKCLLRRNRQIIYLEQSQINQFAGNTIMLKRQAQIKVSNELQKSNTTDKVIIMSKKASDSLYPEQKQQLNKHGEILEFELETIQKFGGGSARCMIAQVY